MWFRRDLRLTDNPALLRALAEHTDVVPVFVVDPNLLKNSGAPRVAYMCDALNALDNSMGRALVYRHGDPVDVILALAEEVGADDVYVARDFAPYGRRRDAEVGSRLKSVGKRLHGVSSSYAVDPGIVTKDDGLSYSVFTPFSKRWLAAGWTTPQDAPHDPQWFGAPSVKCEGPPKRPDIEFELPPSNEDAVLDQWTEYRHLGEEGLDGYSDRRNDPSVNGSSRLSAALRWGIVHPRQLLADLVPSKSHDVYRSELAWREFYADVMFRFPDTGNRNITSA